ncbi:hypothetical protein U9M48_013248 [Paspalum notatum var. saurae]|uniref:Retrotransposon gag domain-containing protein n=1 Tax=Paspalum notatum var. saurae TaxID=547442 RepID=A0AAQ3SZ34_PASNO
MAARYQSLEEKLNSLVDTVKYMSASLDTLTRNQHQMQAQLNLNTEAVHQVMQNQNHLAKQVDATGKAVAQLSLERMAQQLDDSLDADSQVYAPSLKAHNHFGQGSRADGRANRFPLERTQAVNDKFGVYEHRHALTDLLKLKQKGTVEEYVTAFETLQYQFIRGLKPEIQYRVQAQVPDTMERAIMLATIQQQLQETPQIHALAVNDLDVNLTDEVLTQLAMEDTLAEQFCTLSLNAISGTDQGQCMKLRALVNNKVMLVLIDSGSSHSFLSTHFLIQVSCELTSVSPSKVKLANGTEVISNQAIPDFEWWCQGHTFHTHMKVLPLGSYDAILGYDWLESFSPMECDWKNRTLTFTSNQESVTLKEVLPPPIQLFEISAEKLAKWFKGNDIWACALVHPEQQFAAPNIPPEISIVLQEFFDVFATPTSLPPHRANDHHVPLLPGTAPVNSKPYQYSPLHKDEIERQVKQLL